MHTQGRGFENACFEFYSSLSLSQCQDSISAPPSLGRGCEFTMFRTLSFTQYSLQASHSHTLISAAGWIAFSPTLLLFLSAGVPPAVHQSPSLAGDCSGNID